VCGGGFARVRPHLLAKAARADPRAMQPCKVCVSLDESAPVSVASVFQVNRKTRCVRKRKREHRQALRRQSRDPNSKKTLPGKGLPTSEHGMNNLVLIPEIGAAFRLHAMKSWSPVQSIDGHQRSDNLPARDERYALDESGYESQNWWRYGEGDHLGPAGSCPACMAAPECSVPSVGLSTTSARPVLRDDQAVADKRLRRYIRRESYHQTRTWPQDKGNALTERELAAAVHTQWRADRCKDDCVTLERRLPSAGVAMERLQVPLRCGLRLCDDCCSVKKSTAKARMRGEWKQFVTLTIPHDRCSRLHAFRLASSWMTKLGQRLQEVARKGSKQCLAWNCGNRAPHYSMKCEGNSLDYAWVIEEHKDGFPHWHLVWTADYLCYDFLRELWDDITGLGTSHVHVVRINNSVGVSAYLCKYMTKAHYAPEVLAVCYRKRLWASTLPRGLKWDQGFHIVNFTQTKKSALANSSASLPSRLTGTPVDVSGCHWSNVTHMRNVMTSWWISPWWEFVESARSPISRWIEQLGRAHSSGEGCQNLSARRFTSSRPAIPLQTWEAIDAMEGKWILDNCRMKAVTKHQSPEEPEKSLDRSRPSCERLVYVD
jgi:hypothetical protein